MSTVVALKALGGDQFPTSDLSGLGIRYHSSEARNERAREIHTAAIEFLDKGEICLRAGCFEEAKWYFTEVRRLRWDDAEAQFGLERALHGQNNLDLPNPDPAEMPIIRKLREANLKVRSLRLGDTRLEVEALLGPDWVNLTIASFSSGQIARYWNREIPQSKLLITFDWVGKKGVGRTSKGVDPVIAAPSLDLEK